MAISPVSSVSFRNNYNQISFEGKRKEKSESVIHSTSPLKAVPLAVMLAMSPLNSVEAQSTSSNNRQVEVTEVVSARDPYAGQIISADKVRQIDYPSGQEYLNIQVKYWDKNNSPSSIESVKLAQDGSEVKHVPGCERLHFDYPVRTLNSYRINIVGSDGKIGRVIGTTHVIVGSHNSYRIDRYIAREDVVNDLMTFAKSSKNNAFPVKDVQMNIYPNPILANFSMDTPDTSWIRRTGQVNTNYGTRVFGEGHVKTRYGNYVVTFYSNDGNSGDYETVVIQRDDGLRCKVDRLRETKLRFETDDGSDDSIVIKCIDISDPTVGKFTIIDDVMYDSLMTLKPDTVNNKSIRFWNNVNNVVIDENGIH